MKYASVNPATNQLLRSFPFATKDALLGSITRSASAFHLYKRTSLLERQQKMESLATAIEANKAKIAETITTEMGKPIADALGEVSLSAASIR